MGGGNEKVSETQYLTFILRTLGYSDKNGDFSWDKARLLTDKIEITNVDYRLRSFTRGNLAEVSFKALSSQMKDSVATLIDTLYIEGSVTKEKVANVGLSLTSDDVLNAPKNNYKKGDVVRFNDMRFTYGENPVGFYLNEYMGNEKRLEIPETVNGIPVVGITYHIGNISEVVIPRTVSFINYEFEYPSSISYIEVDSRNTSFVVKDNCLLSYDGTICYMVCGGLTDHLIIPEGVKTIGCALSVKAETISLPSSLEVLGRYEESFHTNSALNNQTTAFIVDKDCKYFSSIDGVLFNKDASVLYSYPGANEAEEYTIPSTVKEIYKYAFRNCMNLKQINIPQSVDTVYRGAIQIDDKDYKVVCCEVSKKPSGWDSEWYLECDSSSIKNISQGEYVHWGYKF